MNHRVGRFTTVLVLLAVAAPAQARGLLIPIEKQVPPLAMLRDWGC